MKKALLIVIIIIFLFIIQNLSHSIYSLWQKQELLTDARKELVKEKKENQTIKQQIAAAKSPSFVEEQARDKLLMVKPDEQLVVLSNNLIVPDKAPVNKEVKPKPNWQQWWELFFP